MQYGSSNLRGYDVCVTVFEDHVHAINIDPHYLVVLSGLLLKRQLNDGVRFFNSSRFIRKLPDRVARFDCRELKERPVNRFNI